MEDVAGWIWDGKSSRSFFYLSMRTYHAELVSSYLRDQGLKGSDMYDQDVDVCVLMPVWDLKDSGSYQQCGINPAFLSAVISDVGVEGFLRTIPFWFNLPDIPHFTATLNVKSIQGSGTRAYIGT